MATEPRYAIVIVNIAIIDMVIDPIVAVILATQQLWGRKLHIPHPPLPGDPDPTNFVSSRPDIFHIRAVRGPKSKQ